MRENFCENCHLSDANVILEADNMYYQEENERLKEAVNRWHSIAGDLALKLLGVADNA